MPISQSIFHGFLPQKIGSESIFSSAAGSLDSGSVTYLSAYPNWKQSLSGAGITKGSAYSGLSGMWIRDIRIIGLGDQAECEISLEGLLSGSGDKRHRVISSFGNIVSIGPSDDGGTIVTPAGTSPSWNILDPGVTVIDTYFQTATPVTSVNGTSLAPPSAPSVPPYIWGGYQGDKRANFPSGWVLISRDAEQIYGSVGSPGLWRISDQFDYFQPAIPD